MTEVVDIDVRVTPAQDGYLAFIEQDDSNMTAQRRFAEAAPPQMIEAFRVLHGDARVRGFPAMAAEETSTLDMSVLELGRRLYGALFDDETRDVLVTTRALAHQRGARVRLRLKLDAAPELQEVPWEILAEGEQFLALSDRFVVRCSDDAQPLVELPLNGPLRVLVVASSPADLPALALDAEWTQLCQELRPLTDTDKVVLHRLDDPTFTALAGALTDHVHPWHVVHFMGHGDVAATGGQLALCDEHGNTWYLNAQAFGRLMQSNDATRLVVLNGCRTASDPERRPLQGVASQLMACGVPAVVAMQFPVTDAAAVRFAGALYGSLAAHGLIDQAVADGRTHLLESPEWMTPVLFLRSDGQLFDGPLVAAAPKAPSVQPLERVPPRIVPGDASFSARSWVADEVWRWLADEESRQHLLLTGDLGAGKTVLSAWLAGQGGAASPNADDPLAKIRQSWNAVHFCSTSLVGASTDPRSLVASLCEQFTTTVRGFAAAASVDTPALLTSGAGIDELLRRALEAPLRAALTADPSLRVAVLIDGLVATTRSGEPTFVDVVRRLATLDPRVRLFVAAPNDGDLLQPLLELGPAIEHLDLSSEAWARAVARDVRAFVAPRVAAAVVDESKARQLTNRIVGYARGSFLYAAAVVEHLARDAPNAIDDSDVPPTLAKVYENQLRAALERAYGDDWLGGWVSTVEPLLGVLTVARSPVPLNALADWLGGTKPEMGSLLSRNELFVRTTEDESAIRSPAMARFLADPRGAASTWCRIDTDAAHRRIVDKTMALAPDFRAARARGAAYGLAHLPDHADHLIDSGAALEGLARDVANLVLSDAYVAVLEQTVDDPVLIGKPFRHLADHFAERRDAAMIEQTLTFVASAHRPAVRSALFDVLITYLELDENAAADFLVRLALDDDITIATTAIHATCRLGAPAQARIFRKIVDKGDVSRRIVATFARYGNSRNGSPGLLEQVLDQMLEDIDVFKPLRIRSRLAFFTDVTVTNYVNHCDEPEVVRVTNDCFRRLLVERLRADGRGSRRVERLVEPYMARQLSERVLRLVDGGGSSGAGTAFGSAAPGAELARRVVPALDPRVSLAPLEPELAALLDGEIALFRILAIHVLAVHAVSDAAGSMPVIERLFEGGDPRRRRWLLLALTAPMSDTPVSWIAPLESMTRRVIDDGAALEIDDPVLQGLDLVLVPLALAQAKVRQPMTLHLDLVQSDLMRREVRAGCVNAIGVVGMYHVESALESFDVLYAERDETGVDVAPALALTAALHPLRVRAWAEERGDAELRDRIEGAMDLQRARLYLELLGFFNNAVHQAVFYERIRDGVCRTVYEYYLDSKTRKEWSRRYTRQGLSLLREAEFELIRWTLPYEQPAG